MLTRRRFIGTTLGAGTALATGIQGALPQAQKRMIVDAQVHLWKANTPDWPWVEGAKPQMPEPFTIERALPLMDEAGVDRVVIVPPSGPRPQRLRARSRQALSEPLRGHGPHSRENPKSAALLPKWQEQPGMLGVRVTFNTPQTAWLKDGTADWFWPEAAKARLPVMFLAFGLVNLFDPIAQRNPELPLIIDHMGINTAIAQKGQTAEVIGHVVALAKYPNVSVKLSNLPNSSLEPYPYKDLTPHLKRVFDAYGPQRCHWGTDTTNGQHRGSWRQRLTHFTETIDFMSESDKDWVLGRSILQKLKWS